MESVLTNRNVNSIEPLLLEVADVLSTSLDLDTTCVGVEVAQSH